MSLKDRDASQKNTTHSNTKPLSPLLGTLQSLVKILQENEIMIVEMIILDVEALRFKREVVGAGLTEGKVLMIEIKGCGWKKVSRNPS